MFVWLCATFDKHSWPAVSDVGAELWQGDGVCAARLPLGFGAGLCAVKYDGRAARLLFRVSKCLFGRSVLPNCSVRAFALNTAS